MGEGKTSKTDDRSRLLETNRDCLRTVLPIIDDEVNVNNVRLFPSFRFAMLLFALTFMMLLPGSMFQTLNFGMSCMVKRTTNDDLSDGEGRYLVQQCHTKSWLNGTLSTSKSNAGNPDAVGTTFDWDKTVQSNLLAGYSYGGLLMVYFSGLLCDRLGAKPVMIISSAVATISVLITPFLAQTLGWIPVFIARIFLGLACGSGWPAAAAVASKWSGPKESSLFLSFASTGVGLGIFLSNSLNGFLCSTVGWQWIFYVSGIVGCVYFILLVIFFSSEPKQSRWISLLSSSNPSSQNNSGKRPTPWKSLLTSLPVIATIVSGFSQFMVQGFVGILLPTYFTEAFGARPEAVGMYSAIINLAQVLGRFISGFIAEYVKPFSSETWNTKLFNTASYLVVITCLMGTTLFKCGEDLAVLSLMALQFAVNGLILAGYLRTTILIAPQYIGQIMGLSNFGAYAACIILPYLASALTPNGTIDEWKQEIYFITGAVCIGTISFLLIGSAQEQDWAAEDWTTTTNDSNNKKEEKRKLLSDSDEFNLSFFGSIRPARSFSAVYGATPVPPS